MTDANTIAARYIDLWNERSAHSTGVFFSWRDNCERTHFY
jgi:hypothetical protein